MTGVTLLRHDGDWTVEDLRALPDVVRKEDVAPFPVAVTPSALL